MTKQKKTLEQKKAEALQAIGREKTDPHKACIGEECSYKVNTEARELHEIMSGDFEGSLLSEGFNAIDDDYGTRDNETDNGYFYGAHAAEDKPVIYKGPKREKF